jgi:hypothetical protein
MSHHEHESTASARRSRNPLVRFPARLRGAVRAVRAGYRDLLALALAHRRLFVIGFLGLRRGCRSCWCRSRPQLLSRRSMPARS